MKKKLITSALPYVNNIPHLGNLIQVLSADVFSRFCRLKKYQTLYVCGTDEYGTATETKAQEEGKTPKELCDYYYNIHSNIYSWFEISFDNFGRTSTPQQTQITQEIFLDLYANGYIQEKTIEQLFCTTCDRFLADRYVRGTCPSCGFDDARGDQCENCGKLLDPTELLKPRCSTCNNTPHFKTTNHLYIDLPKIQPLFQEWLSEASIKGQWAKNAIQMTQAWIRDGLLERAITRDLKWGIPVPLKGYEQKVFYVWFDAPIGYISIGKNLFDSIFKDTSESQAFWTSWWLNPENVELFQFIGKDNIPFHTVIFPSSLIGSGKNWTKLFHMSSTEYLNYESGKFSKSRGVGVFGSDAMESGISADMWRFYIFYNRPERADTTFTWKDFQDKVNSELVGNLGNLVNRTFTFVSRYYDGSIPQKTDLTNCREDIKVIIEELRESTKSSVKKINNQLEWANLKDAFKEIFTLSSKANKAFQDAEPWKKRIEDPDHSEYVLAELCYLIKDLMILIHPFMPAFASKVASFFNKEIWSGDIFDTNNKPTSSMKRPENTLSWDDLLQRGTLTIILSPEIIFKPLDDATISLYRNRYSGTQKERKEKEMETTEQAVQNSKDVFNQKIVIKAAKILKVEKHPDAEKLYVETIDDGSGNERIIVSGLVPYFTEEQLLGKSILIADNLKPRKMRGIESKGMLLAADYKDSDGNDCVELLDSSWAKPGTIVTLKGYEPILEKPETIDADTFFSVPLKILNKKVTVDETDLLLDGKPVTTLFATTGEVS